MSDDNSLIPFGKEQAKAIEQALKTLQGFGTFLREMFGTVPEDIVALLGGNWLRVRRAENLLVTLEKARERLEKRGIKVEPTSLSIGLPILIAAADESRDELQEIWARLLAAAADPVRAKAFRNQFIEVVKRMDPLDAPVLQLVQQREHGRIKATEQNVLAEKLGVDKDEVEVSIGNLIELKLAFPLTETPTPDARITAFGREFLKAVSD